MFTVRDKTATVIPSPVTSTFRILPEFGLRKMMRCQSYQSRYPLLFLKPFARPPSEVSL